MLILNDLHISVSRQGGTTPTSREALRTYLLSSIESEINTSQENHICVLGDLFDGFDSEGRDWVATYLIFASWLSYDQARRLTLVAGNHDCSPRALKVSAFEMLCRVLTEQFNGTNRVQVIGIDQWDQVGSDIALAHCSNQETFNTKLGEVLNISKDHSRVLLHCNLDNHFAQQSDHSLDLSAEMVAKFNERGVHILLAHEHNHRTSGNVTVLGCQFPTGVSDCLVNEKKYAHTLNYGVLTKVETWSRDSPNGYSEVDWRDLAEAPTDCGGFFKVTGTASANEAGDCMSAISKFRAKSSAFVISNGVHIEGVAANEDLPESFEATKAFDVMEFIYSNLDSDQTVAVKKLMEVQK